MQHVDGAPEPVVVLATGSAAVIAVAKSILLSSGIEFAVKGEQVQDLFGYGRFPAGNNVFMGPMQLIVSASDASDAAVLLAELQNSVAQSDPACGKDAEPGDRDEAPSRWSRVRSAGRVVAVLILVSMAAEFVLFLAADFFGG